MKITFVSDTHTMHDQIEVEPCDIFCYSGDLTNKGYLFDVVSFFEWLRKIPAKHIIWIAGNHDKSLDKDLMFAEQDPIQSLLNRQVYNDVQMLIKDLPPHIHYLNGQALTIEGINFYGTPVTPRFGVGWAFNRTRDNSIAKDWSKIPKNTNILLTHTPPYDILDYVDQRLRRHPDEDQRTGCPLLFKCIKERLINLKINAFGHIHANYGCTLKAVSNTRYVLFINGAMINNRGKFLIKQPITIDYAKL